MSAAPDMADPREAEAAAVAAEHVAWWLAEGLSPWLLLAQLGRPMPRGGVVVAELEAAVADAWLGLDRGGGA